MLWVPQKGIVQVAHNTGSVGSLNIGTAVTTGASSGTKGSIATLISNLAFDAYWIDIMAFDYGLSATACEGMLDIMIGDVTSQNQVLIPNLLMGHCAGPNLAAIPAGVGKRWSFPLYIPAGAYIGAQAAGARTSTAFRVAVYLYGGKGYPPWRVGTRVVSYPTSPSVPRGLALTPGQSGAEGSWTQVVSATSVDHFAVVPSFQPETDTTVTQKGCALDVGIGAAAAEEMIGEGEWYVMGTGEGVTNFPGFPIFADIPASTRLSARVSNSTTNDTAYGVMLHCVGD
jgi:hypothetical protein